MVKSNYGKINRKFKKWKKSILEWIFFFKFKRKNISIHWKSYIGPNTFIGEFTNINGPIYIDSRDDTKCLIGKYCLISHNVRIRCVNHSTNLLNMQSAFQIKHGFRRSHVPGRDVVIGNNVWIGDNTIILSGVNIGNGAVIGAGSVVTRNVPNFAIYGGNPAKLIKYRFDENTRRLLQDIEWWNWDETKIKKHFKLFNTNLDKTNYQEIKKIID